MQFNYLYDHSISSESNYDFTDGPFFHQAPDSTNNLLANLNEQEILSEEDTFWKSSSQSEQIDYFAICAKTDYEFNLTFDSQIPKLPESLPIKVQLPYHQQNHYEPLLKMQNLDKLEYQYSQHSNKMFQSQQNQGVKQNLEEKEYPIISSTDNLPSECLYKTNTTLDNSEGSFSIKKNKVKKYVILKQVMRQFKNYYKSDFLERFNMSSTQAIKKSKTYSQLMLQYVEQFIVSKQAKEQSQGNKLKTRFNNLDKMEIATFLGSFIFKKPPRYEKKSDKVNKKQKKIRNELLYKVSKVNIERIASESQPFKILLRKFLLEQSDQIIQQGQINNDKQEMIEDVIKYLKSLV